MAKHTEGKLTTTLLLFAAAAALVVPGVVLRLSHFTREPAVEATLFGSAVLGAAMLLGFGAELAEREVSRSLALAVVALVAILPEYAVDLVFAWKAADDPAFAHFAAANMTGSNRLLIGFGWAAVVLIFWYRRGRRPVEIERSQTLELTFLLLATGWAFTIFLRTFFRDGSLNVADAIVMVGLFAAYIFISSRGKVGEHEPLVGPMAPLADLSPGRRRAVTATLFILPAVVILGTAEPFADSLVDTGRSLGIDQFLLVQWVAPLASEAPEIAIACYFAFRGMGQMAMGVLISSKVNQWTLLVGTLPLIYSVSLGRLGELPLDTRQADEFLLTAAQSLFAVLLLASLRISLRGGLVLLFLFITQLFITAPGAREAYSLIYIAFSLALLLWDRARREGTVGLLSRAAKSLRPSFGVGASKGL